MDRDAVRTKDAAKTRTVSLATLVFWYALGILILWTVHEESPGQDVSLGVIAALAGTFSAALVLWVYRYTGVQHANSFRISGVWLSALTWSFLGMMGSAVWLWTWPDTIHGVPMHILEGLIPLGFVNAMALSFLFELGTIARWCATKLPLLLDQIERERHAGLDVPEHF